MQELVCKSLTLVDDQGRDRIALRVHAGEHELDVGPVFEMRDDAGHLRVAVRVTPVGATIDLFDGDGQLQGSLHQGVGEATWLPGS